MNFEIFKFEDKSGKMSKDTFVKNKYPEEYQVIMEFCQEKGLNDIRFKEKVYLFLNKRNSIPVCKNITCKNAVKFQNSTLGYREYCSTKCISSDPYIKNLKKQKSLEKFGTESPAQSLIVKEKIIKTNQERWGANSPMITDEVKEKSKQTLLKNYVTTRFGTVVIKNGFLIFQINI